MYTNSSSAHADVTFRPDGRAFVSVDAWSDAEFSAAAASTVAADARPLFTLVDDSEHEQHLRDLWQQIGFVHHRTEGVYQIPTARAGARHSGVEPFGTVDPHRIDALCRKLRGEIESVDGWHTMPAELIAPDPESPTDPRTYAVAVRDGRDVGLLRVSGRAVQPRIGLLAVLAADRRRGIGAALLGEALRALAERGVGEVVTEVDDTRHAARLLLERFSARRVSTVTELVLR